jgi:hypothetical protein
MKILITIMAAFLLTCTSTSDQSWRCARYETHTEHHKCAHLVKGYLGPTCIGDDVEVTTCEAYFLPDGGYPPNFIK